MGESTSRHHKRTTMQEANGGFLKMVMFQSYADRLILDWAGKHGYPCHYGATSGGTEYEIRVYLNHARASFVNGKLGKLTHRNDGAHADDMVDELARLFALCGYLEMLNDTGENQCKQTSSDEPTSLAPKQSEQSIQPPRRSYPERLSVRPNRFMQADENVS